jgi:hypothetical protein
MINFLIIAGCVLMVLAVIVVLFLVGASVAMSIVYGQDELD